jgi:hypothetical protein
MDRTGDASAENFAQEESRRKQDRKIAQPLWRIGENESPRIESHPLSKRGKLLIFDPLDSLYGLA